MSVYFECVITVCVGCECMGVVGLCGDDAMGCMCTCMCCCIDVCVCVCVFVHVSMCVLCVLLCYILDAGGAWCVSRSAECKYRVVVVV